MLGRVFIGTDCTEFRNLMACQQRGGVCLQGVDDPTRWYCTLACVTQNQATCTKAKPAHAVWRTDKVFMHCCIRQIALSA